MSQTHSIFVAAPARRLTGPGVLTILVAFFGIVATVDATMMFLAVSTFRGEDISRAYEKGLSYNLDIAGARAQGARDWKVEAAILRRSESQSRIAVSLHDAQGLLAGLQLQATIRSPVDAKNDVVATLIETSPGHYEAPIAIAPGWRDLVLTAAQGGREVFRSKNRVRID